MNLRNLGLALAGFALAGCSVGPNYKTPRTPVPAAFSDYSTPATQPATQPGISNADIVGAWWTTFNDPILNRLIEQSAAANLDLRAAEARVREARAARGVVASNWYPTVDASGNYTRSRRSKNVTVGAPSSLLPTEQDLFQAGFDATWEIDVFGGVRRNVEAANADIESSVANRNDVLLSLLGEVARNYVELRGAQRQVAIAEENVKSQRQTLDLTRAKLNAGLTSDLDVARSEAQVSTTESTIPSLQAQVAQAIHRLSVLTGKEPNALAGELGQPAAIPAPAPQVPVGVPSDLLRRRPDIRRAERNLAAATARIGVATSDLFPKFTLVGNLGQESQKFKNLFDSSSTFWSIGPGVSVPIFNAGRLRANVAVERARTDAALATYEQTVLNSLEEVENALVSYQKEFVRRDALARSVSSNQRAVQLSQQLYQRGLTNFLDLLDAQRALYVAEDDLARSDTLVSSNAVALLKALGGGWDVKIASAQ